MIRGFNKLVRNGEKIIEIEKTCSLMEASLYTDYEDSWCTNTYYQGYTVYSLL